MIELLLNWFARISKKFLSGSSSRWKLQMQTNGDFSATSVRFVATRDIAEVSNIFEI